MQQNVRIDSRETASTFSFPLEVKMKTRRIIGLLMLVAMLSVNVYGQGTPRGAQRSSKRATYETATTKSGRTVIFKKRRHVGLFR